MADTVGPASPDVTQVDIDGIVTVYAPAIEQVLILNATASDVWRLADGTRDLDTVTESLAEHYGVTVPSIAADVSTVVRMLMEAGLIASVDRLSNHE